MLMPLNAECYHSHHQCQLYAPLPLRNSKTTGTVSSGKGVTLQCLARGSNGLYRLRCDIDV